MYLLMRKNEELSECVVYESYIWVPFDWMYLQNYTIKITLILFFKKISWYFFVFFIVWWERFCSGETGKSIKKSEEQVNCKDILFYEPRMRGKHKICFVFLNREGITDTMMVVWLWYLEHYLYWALSTFSLVC